MKCWKCGTEQDSISGEKLSFRAACKKCELWLHSCLNCRYYKQGLPNNCMIPGTEPIYDREKWNFCEEYSPNEGKHEETADPEDAAKRLFGDVDAADSHNKEAPEDRFKSLFDD